MYVEPLGPEGYIDTANVKQWSRSMWEEVMFFLVPFGSQIFDAFFYVFYDLVIFVYFDTISIYFNAVKCFIYIYFVYSIWFLTLQSYQLWVSTC